MTKTVLSVIIQITQNSTVSTVAVLLQKGREEMITLDYADKRPIYEQIKEKIRELIISGVMKAHDKIPSVRELAANLSINPNTIQKAYRELENEGYIYSVAAKGSFVSPREETENMKAGRAEELLKILRRNVEELKFLGISKDEICNYVAEVYQKEEKDNND